MLEPKTTLDWTRALVAFVNGEPEALPLPGTELLRAHAERVLREWIAPKAVEDPGTFARLRRDASLARRLFKLGEDALLKLPMPRKRKRPISARAAKRWGLRVKFLHEWNFSIAIPLTAHITFDRGGRVVLRGPTAQSAEAFIAITLAEVMASSAPAQVRICKLDTCRRLFVHDLAARHRPRECCCTAHSNTFRSRKKRAKERKRQ